MARKYFTVTSNSADGQIAMDFAESGLGIGNRLTLLDDEIVKNLEDRDDERVIRQRREWYRMHQEGELSLEGLDKKAPLTAQAVRRQPLGRD